jgi:dienelactone hydrolase
MPVRLNGLIAAPETGGPYPVVLIFHGTHPGCPVDEMGVDRWPCTPEVEQPNYQGFEYLVRELAARGYVALSININAENTFGFGEPVPGERLQQIIDRHLQALAAAAAGGPNEFGVELTGRADVNRLALFGHSRGGEAALVSANSPEMLTASQGYGPVAGVLLIAAATVTADPWSGSAVPLATILAACDGDVTAQDGQFFFEGVRLAQPAKAWAATAWLERANHNAFNTILPGDPFGLRGRPDCETLL